MTDSRRRIGVCGLGSIGLRHARLLASRGGVALAVFDPAVPNDLPDEISTAARAASFEELLDLAPDGVVIATPDQFHAPLTIAACARRVPVLVEKPVADSLGAVDSMLSASETTGTPVLVGHVLRHTKALRLASGLLHGGAIGTPLSFHATVGAYETLERARSRFGSESFRLPFDYVHEWDYLQWLLGRVERCAAVGRRAGDLDLTQDPNLIDVLMTTETGVSGSVHMNYVERFGARAVRIVGDRGVLEVDLRAGRVTVERRDLPPEVHDASEARDTAFEKQLEHFLAVASGSERALVTIATARRAVAVAEGVVAACRGGAWVEIDAAG